jgi:hypothetical protein
VRARFVDSYAAERFGVHMPEDLTTNLLADVGEFVGIEDLLEPYSKAYWMVQERAQSVQFPYPEEHVEDTELGPIIKVPVKTRYVPAWAVEIASAVVAHRR